MKVFRYEPGSSAVIDAISREAEVVVSSLVELEVMVQLKAEYLGGGWSKPRWRQLETQFSLLRNQPPYEFRNLPSAIFQTALRQHKNSANKHCRSLDRLHLAAMEELEVSRLMTHDASQAMAATEAGFDVLCPR